VKRTARILFGMTATLLLNGTELGMAQSDSRTISLKCRLSDEDPAHPSPITIETNPASVTTGIWVISPRWGHVFCATKRVDGAYAPVYVWEAKRVANNDYHTRTPDELVDSIKRLGHDSLCQSYYDQEGTDTNSPVHQVVRIEGSNVTWGSEENASDQKVVDIKTGWVSDMSGEKIVHCSVSRGGRN
jgi:hypothetical protein